MEQAIRRALANIARHGDTDIFPFPTERYVLADEADKCATYISTLHKEFDKMRAQYPPSTIDSLTQIGYTGFRRATQIEPFWNAYYLALVIKIADAIEETRLSRDLSTVFSYRYEWNDENASLFADSTWYNYRERAYALSQEHAFVVQTDIADYYPRINHHKLENALDRIGAPPQHTKKILALLSSFSHTLSYGLPIGGPASRILAELALVDSDKHLHARGVVFCRYADDYSIFCQTEAEAYRALVLLSEKLFNERLSLQKNKTQIYSAAEFAQIHRFLDPQTLDNPTATEEQKLLNISLRFDPYSPTAEDDYEALKNTVSQIDVIGILAREVSKTQIDQTVTKQALNALRALENYQQAAAVRVLLDEDNLVALSPVFVHLMRTVRGLYKGLPSKARDAIDGLLLSLFHDDSHVLSVELNLAYFVQVLGIERNGDKESVLISIFENTTSLLLRRQIISIMQRWKCHYFLTDLRQRFDSMSEWERRAFILASYSLGDEGSHWRDHTKNTFTPASLIVRDWFTTHHQNDKELPE